MEMHDYWLGKRYVLSSHDHSRCQVSVVSMKTKAGSECSLSNVRHRITRVTV